MDRWNETDYSGKTIDFKVITIQGLTKQKYTELESTINDKSCNKNVIVITNTTKNK